MIYKPQATSYLCMNTISRKTKITNTSIAAAHCVKIFSFSFTFLNVRSNMKVRYKLRMETEPQNHRLDLLHLHSWLGKF